MSSPSQGLFLDSEAGDRRLRSLNWHYWKSRFLTWSRSIGPSTFRAKSHFLSQWQSWEWTRRWKWYWIRIIREPFKLDSFRSRTSRLLMLILNLFCLDAAAQWQDWKFFDASDTLNRIAPSNGDCGYSSGFLVIPESGSNLQAHYRITNVITYLSFKTPINSMILVLVFSRLFEIGYARGLTTESLWCFSFESSRGPRWGARLRQFERGGLFWGLEMSDQHNSIFKSK